MRLRTQVTLTVFAVGTVPMAVLSSGFLLAGEATGVLFAIGLVNVLAVALAALVVGRRLIERKVLGPIDRLARLAHMMGRSMKEDADHGTSVDPLSQGSEVQRLAAAFQEMLERFAEQIMSTVASIGTASGRILETSTKSEAGVTLQSKAVEQVGLTMDMLVAWGEEVAKAAQTVLSNAESTQANNQQVAARIVSLGAHFERITDILETIKDVARKSELLALNASLEGTKAGDVGRGFSLVAEQMQGLAESVMRAVATIKELTGDVRASTSASILATEEAAKIAKDTTDSARRIRAAVTRQQQGTREVSAVLEEVAAVASDNAQQNKEVCQTVRTLGELGAQLETQVANLSRIAQFSQAD